MDKKRKQIRVIIPAELTEDYAEAKERAEKVMMMSMTDSQYATKLITWAIKNSVL